MNKQWISSQLWRVVKLKLSINGGARRRRGIEAEGEGEGVRYIKARGEYSGIEKLACYVNWLVKKRNGFIIVWKERFRFNATED